MSMKKKVRLLLMTFLLAASSVLPVYAAGSADSASVVPYSENSYYEVYNNMTCLCTINSARSVTAGTAMDGQTVTINSRAYGASGNSIGSGGNAGGSSTTTNYTTTENINYVDNTHSAPNLGITYSRRIFR